MKINKLKILTFLVLLTILAIPFSFFLNQRNLEITNASTYNNLSVDVVRNQDSTIDEILTLTVNQSNFYLNNYSPLEFKTQVLLDLNLLVQDEILTEIVKEYNASWESNQFVAYIKFKDSKSYFEHYGLIEKYVNKSTINKSTFTTTVVYSISGYAGKSDVFNIVKDLCDSEYTNIITEGETQFRYIYNSPYKRMHSNSNYIISLGEAHNHIWNVFNGEGEQTLTIYFNYANSYIFLFIYIGVSVLVGLILLLIYLIINHNKKIKNNKNN